MLVTTVKEQRTVGRVARASGGYFELARKIAKRRKDAEDAKKAAAATADHPNR